MSDRRYFEITLMDQDVPRFGAVLGREGEAWWDGEQDCPVDGIRDLWINESPWGLYDERCLAASSGIPFLGSHGAGECYGAYRFAALGGKMVEVAELNGSIMVPIDPDLKVPFDELRQVKRYWQLYRKVRKAFRMT